MGTVLAVFKIMPEDMDYFDKIKAKVKEVLPEGVELQEMKDEPIAFGLKAIIVAVTMEDKGGVIDKVEEALKGIPHVESVTTEGVTLV